MNASLPNQTPHSRKLLLPMRLGVSSVARIELPEGDDLLCATQSLSRRELVLNCNDETLRKLLPTGCTRPDARREVRASFYLPARSSDARNDRGDLVECRTRIQAARRVARDRYLISLEIESLDAEDAILLDSFIEHCKTREVQFGYPATVGRSTAPVPLHRPGRERQDEPAHEHTAALEHASR